MQITYTSPVKGLHIAEVPTGTLKISRVPGHGLMGVHKPNEGRAQVLVSPGKVRTLNDLKVALVEEWKTMVGLGIDTARFIN